MKSKKRPKAVRQRLCAVCAVVGIGLSAWTWADGSASSTEIYNGLENTPGTSGFWGTSGYSGSLNSIGMYDCGEVLIGSGSSGDATVVAGAKGFEPFCSYALESSARELDSREPRGMVIRVK